MQIKVVGHRSVVKNSLVALLLILFLLTFCVPKMDSDVTIIHVSLTTSSSPRGTAHLSYRNSNGDFNVATFNESSEMGIAKGTVNWKFPEKQNGEYLKIGIPKPYPDLQNYYYKDGSYIYQNSLLGEKKVFEIPRGKVGLKILGNFQEMMFLIVNE